MFIATERDVTAAVLAEAARAPDARTREILHGRHHATCTPSCATRGSPKTSFVICAW